MVVAEAVCMPIVPNPAEVPALHIPFLKHTMSPRMHTLVVRTDEG
jgi:hypothetical protein